MLRRLPVILLLLGLPFIYFWKGASMQVLLGDGDTFTHTLPVWTYAAEQLRHLSLPFWTHHIFSGYPLFAEPQSCAFHPSKLLFFLFSPLAAINLTVLLCYGLAGVSCYLLAREEELTVESSLFAGVSFGFGGYLIGHQAHTGLLTVATAFPVLFYTIKRTARTLDYWAIAVNALVVLYLILSGHPQLVFYALMFSFLYAAYLFWRLPDRSGRRRFVICMAGSYALGAALSAFQWLPTLQFSRATTRQSLTYRVFAGPAPDFGDLLASLISTRLHGFMNKIGSEAMLHMGLIVLLMAVIGILARRKQALFWVILLAFVSLLYVGGHTYFYRLMYWVPGYNLFRIPSRTGVALQLALAMLAAHGLTAVQTGSFKARLLGWKRWIAIAAIPAIYYFGIHWAEYKVFHEIYWARVGHGLFSSWGKAEWLGLLKSAGPYVAIMIVAVAALFLLIRWTGRGRVVALVVTGLAFFYFWDYRTWLYVADTNIIREALGAKPPLPREPEPYRMALGSHGNWTGFHATDTKNWHKNYTVVGGPSLNLLNRVSTIGGYSPLILRDYTRLAGEMGTGGEISNERLFSSPVLNLLNVKYVLVPLKGPALAEDTFSKLELVQTTDLLKVYKNPNPCGPFWGVNRLDMFASKNFWRELQAPGNDFSQTAFLSRGESSGLRGKTFPQPLRVHTSYPDGNHIRVDAWSLAPTFLASSHLYYPGWSAELDGAPIDIVRVNGLFMGVAVPEGKHRLMFSFSPLTFWLGLTLAASCLIVFFVAARLDWLRLRRPTAA